MQSKKLSLIEVTTATMLKFVASLPIQMFIVFPLFHIEVKLFTNIGVWLGMTASSMMISYLVRRYFNKLST